MWFLNFSFELFSFLSSSFSCRKLGKVLVLLLVRLTKSQDIRFFIFYNFILFLFGCPKMFIIISLFFFFSFFLFLFHFFYSYSSPLIQFFFLAHSPLLSFIFSSFPLSFKTTQKRRKRHFRVVTYINEITMRLSSFMGSSFFFQKKSSTEFEYSLKNLADFVDGEEPILADCWIEVFFFVFFFLFVCF